MKGDKERADLIEMWGYFIGREYAHRRYGPNAHSALIEYYNPANPIGFGTSWYAASENGGTNGRLFDWEHIPSAFLHDICDDNLYNIQQGLQENNSVIFDRISNYSIGTIYNFLDGSTTTASSLIDKLGTQLPAGVDNTFENYNLLKSYYGY
jgi:hypothetical protein